MEQNQFSRTELLIGKEGVAKLKEAKVAVFGIGGVGSFLVEGLARAGIGEFILIDFDKVDITNINRQIEATHLSIGKYKVDVMKERILKINPMAKVKVYKEFYLSNSDTEIIKKGITYVVDCVDTVKAKIEIIEICKNLGIPIISSMGTGNKLDPLKFEITDIFKTDTCPLAKVMRKELRKRNIKNLKVIYSKEEPIKTNSRIPGSVSFVPSVAGLVTAGEVVKDIIFNAG